MTYYGLDWLANICFLSYVFGVHSQYAKHTHWLAIFGCFFQMGFTFLAGSIPSFIAAIFFLFAYSRSLYVLTHKSQEVYTGREHIDGTLETY